MLQSDYPFPTRRSLLPPGPVRKGPCGSLRAQREKPETVTSLIFALGIRPMSARSSQNEATDVHNIAADRGAKRCVHSDGKGGSCLVFSLRFAESRFSTSVIGEMRDQSSYTVLPMVVLILIFP